MACGGDERGSGYHVLRVASKGILRFIIAIDGSAASGKGTLARRLADYYHLPHLDTGLTYRAVAHLLIEKGGRWTTRRMRSSGAAGRSRQSRPHALSAHAVGEAASRVAVISGTAAHPRREAARLRPPAPARCSTDATSARSSARTPT
jgi:cytidylate kinase